jgi:predicted phosphodiesterase
MLYGKPWTKKEEEILMGYPGGNPLGVQTALNMAGFKRSIEAIQRKKQRLNISPVVTPMYTSAWSSEAADELNNWIPPKKKNKIDWVNGDLPLNKDVTKFVLLNDVHVPHNIELETIFEFFTEFKPDYAILNGDIINNDPFSHWDKQSPMRFKNMPQPKPYYEQCNEIFYRPLREAVGKKCKIVHGIGNHEAWSNKAIGEMPEGEGYWEVENNLENIDSWYASKTMVNLGKLFFVHGDIIQGGQNHSFKMLNYFRRNLRYGHYHDLQERSYNNPIDITERHTARSCGTLQKFNPSFMGNRPHDWMHCFTYGYVFSDGTFHDHTTLVVDNKFMANGKLYGN